MASDPNKKDLFDFELPEGLDDDLGGDWESAFQAEDFMLSPEEEGEIPPGQQAGEDVNLAALLEEGSSGKTSQSLATAGPVTEPTADRAPTHASRAATLLAAILLLISRGRRWYISRSRFQKILFPVLCAVPLIVLSAVLFFRSTTEQLQQAEQREKEPTHSEAPPPPDVTAPPLPIDAVTTAPPSKQTEPFLKNRKKWSLPGFFITARHEQSGDSATISVDLTLILMLEPGQALPEEQKSHVRDAIYQFYRNRPAEELRRYALARGEMIRNLESWLKKAWPNGPVASIIFDRYRVIQ